MAGGGGDAPLIQPAASGGEFLLSLLQRSNHQPQTPQPPQHQQQQQQQQRQPQFPPPFPSFITSQVQNPPHHRLPYQHQQQSVAIDPAVAAVGPSLPINSQPSLWQSNSNGHDLPSQSPRWPHNLGFPSQNHAFPHQGNQFPPPAANQQRVLPDDFQKPVLSSVEIRPNHTIHNLAQQKQQQVEQKLQFGSFSNEYQTPEGLLNANSKLNVVKERELGVGTRNLNGLDRNRQFENSLREQRGGGGGGWGRQQQNYRSPQPPPGFSIKSRGGGDRDYMSRRRELEYNVNRERTKHSELETRNVVLNGDVDRVRRSKGLAGLTAKLDHPGAPAGSNLQSVSASDIEESLMTVEIGYGEGGKEDDDELHDVGEDLVESLSLERESAGKKETKRNPKESRSDNRGQRILSQRMRMIKRQMECRRDIDRFNSAFLAIHESLIPLEEEKAKQKQLSMLLEKLVKKEWPEARLSLYGSCANSFGVRNSDIDVCLAINDADNKSEVLLKLADILQSENLQNVQALTRARVPIVKLMDPVTGISCDICINNDLAVVNTILLWNYAQIDVRLRQLAYIVKHWAKSRGVNATYQGTLSSYAYVLMCIHFLQQRRPAILPCLQEMETTYSVTVDDIECAYFNQVEKLHGFGSRNRETIAQLVKAFFNYWAYRHDYANAVISVRTGSILSKREKEWTRRIGNDRHLICIEDPFEISHDLGRVVDKKSIKVLREEFERAAEIMQYDPNPCVTLFEPYVPS